MGPRRAGRRHHRPLQARRGRRRADPAAGLGARGLRRLRRLHRRVEAAAYRDGKGKGRPSRSGRAPLLGLRRERTPLAKNTRLQHRRTGGSPEGGVALRRLRVALGSELLRHRVVGPRGVSPVLFLGHGAPGPVPLLDFCKLGYRCLRILRHHRLHNPTCQAPDQRVCRRPANWPTPVCTFWDTPVCAFWHTPVCKRGHLGMICVAQPSCTPGTPRSP